MAKIIWSPKAINELESIKGEDLEWNGRDLGITNRAWNRVIHKGIKPVRVFAHPEVICNWFEKAKTLLFAKHIKIG